MEEGRPSCSSGLPLESIELLDSAIDIFRRALLKSLSPRQLVVLEALPDLLPADNMTVFSKKLANSTISEPTLRRAIQRLRGLGLVDCGDKANKGRPLELTEFGRIILKVEGGCDGVSNSKA